MACVSKRRGKWVADYRDPTGKRRWITCDTKREAEAALAKVNVAITSNTYVAPASRTLEEVHESWRKQCVEGSDNRAGRPLAMRTQALYSLTWRLYVAPMLASRKVQSIETEDIARWKQELETRVGPKSVIGALQMVDSLLKHARSRKWSTSNPLETLHRPKYKAKVRAASPDELAELLKHADGDTRLLIRFKSCTGLRASELFGVRFEDIDFARGGINVTRQLADGVVLPVKTEKSNRFVPLPKSLVQVLREHPLRFQGGLVFRSPEGGPVCLSNFHKRTWQPLIKRAGIQKLTERGRLTFHSLRHSAATAAIAAGENVKTVQTNLGHSSAMTTLDTYAEAWAALENHSAEGIERVLYGATGSKTVATEREATLGSAQVVELMARPERFELPTLRFEDKSGKKEPEGGER